MKHTDNNNPARLSDESLLDFLSKGPQDIRSSRDGVFSPVPPVAESGVEDSTEASKHCLDPAASMRLVLGIADAEESELLLAHAAICPACGDLLARGLNTLEGNPSPEEAAAIEELAAARIDWQRNLARKLAGTKSRKRPSLMHSRRWMVMGAVAAGLIAAAGVFLWQRETNTPERQLAKAYEQARNLELRIPDATFTGLVAGSHTRGAATGNEPAPLLEARARLARDLERSPHDPRLEQLQARADILEEHYDSATDVLDRLLAQGPVTAELLTDAASAYYQRGLVSGSELDRSTALDYLRRADELAPTDPVILFNEAIVMEDRGQMMNAVEVWNRYITVERDPKWAAEGKRKLAALEQTLNRLKSHESRINQMLATPEAMEALAADKRRLASLDEELSSHRLNTLLQTAYPIPSGLPGSSGPPDPKEARGSPCSAMCMSARRLLKYIATSLELEHHDFWLNDLISPDPGSLPPTTLAVYLQGLQLLGKSVQEDMRGIPANGAPLALRAREFFRQIEIGPGSDPLLKSAARAGGERSAFEYMFSLQRSGDFDGCRKFAQQLRARPGSREQIERYTWIEIQELETEKICDDTPGTRKAGRDLEQKAMRLAQANNYGLLIARIHTMEFGDAQNSGDVETAERLILNTLRELSQKDPPLMRFASVVSGMPLIAIDSPLAHMAESSQREELAWILLQGTPVREAQTRTKLARAEIRIGAMREAANQLRLANAAWKTSGAGHSRDNLTSEPEIFLAATLLERGDLDQAGHHLDLAAGDMSNFSDVWGLREYAMARGQLQLAEGHLSEAAHILEADIRTNEGKNVHGGDRETSAEYTQQDHDLYAELAATWLAQGRSPESVLALWERFRLRSRGLRITQCRAGALDCEQPLLVSAQRQLGHNILIGQILLLDRVLIYQVDRNGVTWSQKPWRRHDILDAGQTLERAVSSPFTSQQTAEKLGIKLSDALLPRLPASLSSDAALLLEPDPLLQNLSWPVLPTPAGPLGLEYPLAELRSILADTKEKSNTAAPGPANGDQALVIGASVASEGEPPLPEAITEAQSVNRFLHSSALLIGKQATTTSVANELGSATVFHFAGHAVQTGSGTELLLAPASPADKASWIDGTFLRQHPPRACRLAVLSACATGRRQSSWNHPLQDIVETLGSLGVPAVVATRWQIDSEAAVPFMDSFYGSLAKGNNVALALTSARRVQSLHSLYRNPYYWGAYYVTESVNSRSAEENRASF
jgi:tetratricopeptide (TPR) repeat protein